MADREEHKEEFENMETVEESLEYFFDTKVGEEND